MAMRNLKAKSIVSALGGHPPNVPLLDIAHGLSGSASRDNIGKAMAGARAHRIKVTMPQFSMASGPSIASAPSRSTSFAKSMDMGAPIRPSRAPSLLLAFMPPRPMRGAGYFAPLGRSVGATAPSLAA